jgi:hypothetical protein
MPQGPGKPLTFEIGSRIGAAREAVPRRSGGHTITPKPPERSRPTFERDDTGPEG